MLNALLGGSIIGVAVSMMLFFNGKVTGISGILGGVLNPGTSDKSWRMLFLTGLFTGGLLFNLFSIDQVFSIQTQALKIDYVFAGFLVGFGTLLGNGCTSGHGVCGISRFSARSLVATVVFIISGILSVQLFRFFRGEL